MASLAFAAWVSGAAQAVEPASPKLAVGINYIGGQIDYDFTPNVRGELRLVTGSQASPSGTVSSRTFGARAYRLFGSSATRFYCGAELAYVKASQRGSVYRVTGAAGGGFIGMERKFARRAAVGVDAGPYFFSLREAATNASETTFDFVLNTYVLLYLF